MAPAAGSATEGHCTARARGLSTTLRYADERWVAWSMVPFDLCRYVPGGCPKGDCCCRFGAAHLQTRWPCVAVVELGVGGAGARRLKQREEPLPSVMRGEAGPDSDLCRSPAQLMSRGPATSARPPFSAAAGRMTNEPLTRRRGRHVS